MLPIRIEKTAHPKPLPPDEARLGFGEIFTDHMALADWTREDGWHNARVIPFGPLPLHPASTCLHYAAEIFEGLKAYRRPDGAVQLFRPWENVARLNRSCDRLGLPQLNPDDALQAIAEAACLANEAGEDIGARRLHAVFEELLEDISFNAGGDEMPDVYLNITADYVREHLDDIMQTTDTHRYIL